MDSYTGEIRAFPYATMVPANWVPCNGQLLDISQYGPLFAVIAATFGGNGTTQFAVPNLQGRAVMGTGNGPKLSPRQAGDHCGTSTVTLDGSQLPAHSHAFNAVFTTTESAFRTAGPDPVSKTNEPPRSYPSFITIAGTRKGEMTFKKAPVTPDITMMDGAILLSGGLDAGAPPAAHENMQPYVALKYYICCDGVYPG